MSDDPLADKIHRGQRAQALLAETWFLDLFNELETGLISSWMGTKPDDMEGREQLWLTVVMLFRLRQLISVVAANGRVAQSDLDRIIRDREN